jgi:hypothetical protein
MEIKLKQSEIEDAVRAYLNGIFALASGSTFGIDFQATRGPEGFIANIVIGEKNAAPAPKEEKAELVDEPVPAQTTEAKPQAQATQPKAKRLVLDNKPKDEPVVTDPVPETKDPEPETPVVNEADKPPFNEGEGEGEVVAQTTGFKGFEKDVDASSAADANAEATAEAAAETAATTVEQPVRKSLFGGLGKPSNS